jgi:hypothetical protein
MVKRLILTALVSIMLTAAICGYNATAGVIKSTGIAQKDLYSFLSATVTLCNSLKTNLNLVQGVDSANITKYNAMFSSYSTYLVTVRTKKGAGFNSYSAAVTAIPTIGGSKRMVSGGASTVSATSLSLTQ